MLLSIKDIFRYNMANEHRKSLNMIITLLLFLNNKYFKIQFSSLKMFESKLFEVKFSKYCLDNFK